MRNRTQRRIAAAALLLAGGLTMEAYAANPNWYQDSQGLHYFKTNTQLAKNEFVAVDGKIYSFDDRGVLQTGWISRNNTSYYAQSDGALTTGWIEDGGKKYYLQSDGSLLKDAVTPDQYLVDSQGVQVAGYRVIAGVKVQQPSLFVRQDSSAMYNWTALMGAVQAVGQVAYQQTSGARGFHVYSDKLSWCERSGSDEKELLSLEKVSGTGGYRLRIKTVLDRTSIDSLKGASYDYQVLRLFCYGISSAASDLDDAIYTSFVGKNPYGIGNDRWVSIGDCLVRFSAEDGAGCYEIQPLQ